MDSGDNSRRTSVNTEREIFLLTTPSHSDRARLCLRLIARSEKENPVLYLAGDGVYNLLDSALKFLPRERVLVCREDLEARGVQAGERATVPDDFYELLVEDIMAKKNLAYTF